MPASSQVIIFQKKGSRFEGNFFMYIIAAWDKKSEELFLFPLYIDKENARTFCAAFHFRSENFVLNHFIYKSSSCGRTPAARSHIVSSRGSSSILV